MQAILLGTAGYHPSESRHTPGLFLPEAGILLDAGTGTFRLHRYLQSDALAIFLSHAHLDHVCGLTYLLGLQIARPDLQLSIYAAPEVLTALREHLFSAPLFPLVPKYAPCPLRGLVELPGQGTLRWFPLEHPGGALGFRLDWPNHSLAYVTDTTASEDAPYAEHLAGVDLLVHECNFGDERAEFAARTGHSSTSAVASLARRAGVGRLLLVHVDPQAPEDDPVGLAAARRIFPATILGHDQQVVEF